VWNSLIMNIITNSWVTWQGIAHKLPEDNRTVSKHLAVIICEIIVYLLVIVQNKKNPEIVSRLVGWKTLDWTWRVARAEDVGTRD
jgi:hypothetical protein